MEDVASFGSWHRLLFFIWSLKGHTLHIVFEFFWYIDGYEKVRKILSDNSCCF